MKALVNEKTVDPSILQVPNMNYGQLDRWKDFVKLSYQLSIDKKEFIEKVHNEFSEFRRNEIEEDDTNDIIELEEYKTIGRPDIETLIDNHPDVLEGVLKLNDYLILHSIVSLPIPRSEFYYSINSLDSISVENDSVILRGICFKSDYIEHAYDSILTRKNALLKTKT